MGFNVSSSLKGSSFSVKPFLLIFPAAKRFLVDRQPSTQIGYSKLFPPIKEICF